MKTPIIRATITPEGPEGSTNGHYVISGQALDDACQLVNWGFSTFSLVRFEAELSYIKANYDCQIVREFKP